MSSILQVYSSLSMLNNKPFVFSDHAEFYKSLIVCKRYMDRHNCIELNPPEHRSLLCQPPRTPLPRSSRPHHPSKVAPLMRAAANTHTMVEECPQPGTEWQADIKFRPAQPADNHGGDSVFLQHVNFISRGQSQGIDGKAGDRTEIVKSPVRHREPASRRRGRERHHQNTK